jgi:hypothetical protein
VILGLLFFLAFVSATRLNQQAIALRPPLLVGFFLAALIIHEGCQQWWIPPVLGSLSKWPLTIGATILTAFNDNAAVTYLASLVPGFSDAFKNVVMAGAVTGGGLTVIANSPNPAGESILASRFGERLEFRHCTFFSEPWFRQCLCCFVKRTSSQSDVPLNLTP